MEILARLVSWFRSAIWAQPNMQPASPSGRSADPLIEGYEVIKEIGRGATGTIYLGRRRPWNDKEPSADIPNEARVESSLVAIKVSHGQANDPLLAARFCREVEIVGRIAAPIVPRILASGRTTSQQLYLVMQYVKGLDIAKLRQKEGRIPDGRLLPILRQLSDGIAEIHRLGIVHRDIKPSNIMLHQCQPTHEVSGQTISESIKLLDFGLATSLDQQVEVLSAPSAHGGAATLALASGTPHYAAPETWRSATLPDPRSDIYSLGCCSFHLLVGRTPFHGNNPLEVCAKHLREAPEDLRQLNLPIARPLAEIVMRCLSKDPAQRPQSAGELGWALSQITPCQPWTDAAASDWWNKNGSTDSPLAE